MGDGDGGGLQLTVELPVGRVSDSGCICCLGQARDYTLQAHNFSAKGHSGPVEGAFLRITRQTQDAQCPQVQMHPARKGAFVVWGKESKLC
jgi:hypothetical protein